GHVVFVKFGRGRGCEECRGEEQENGECASPLSSIAQECESPRHTGVACVVATERRSCLAEGARVRNRGTAYAIVWLLCTRYGYRHHQGRRCAPVPDQGAVRSDAERRVARS